MLAAPQGPGKHYSYKSNQPSYMVDYAPEKARIPTAVIGIIFTYISPHEIPNISRVCKQWNRWYQDPINLKAILLAHLPTKHAEIGTLPTTATKAGQVDVPRFFRTFMRTFLNLKENRPLINATISQGKVLDCSFTRDSKEVSYIVSYVSNSGFKIVTSDNEEINLPPALFNPDACFHRDGLYYVAINNGFYKIQGQNRTVVANFVTAKRFEEIKKDGDLILGLQMGAEIWFS